jgi:exopolyphosphatase/guanosine-5'-triphosphate,3'-diphosphate pyrophosphatase
VDERFSVDVGAVRYTERFRLDRAVSPEVLREAMAAISADLSRIDGRPVPDALVAMGGVVTNITAVKHRLASYDPEVVQGSVLDRAEIDRQIELYRFAGCRRPPRHRRPAAEAGGSHPRRCLHRPHGDGKAGQESFTVSDRGLRHGVLAERFGA